MHHYTQLSPPCFLFLFLTIRPSIWAFFKTTNHNSRISLNWLLAGSCRLLNHRNLFCFILLTLFLNHVYILFFYPFFYFCPFCCSVLCNLSWKWCFRTLAIFSGLQDCEFPKQTEGRKNTFQGQVKSLLIWGFHLTLRIGWQLKLTHHFSALWCFQKVPVTSVEPLVSSMSTFPLATVTTLSKWGVHYHHRNLIFRGKAVETTEKHHDQNKQHLGDNHGAMVGTGMGR